MRRRPARSRRAVLVGTSLLGLAAAAGLLYLAVGAAPAADAPSDIVLVVWDTCRADRTSLLGYDKPTTPFLESFAAGGVTFGQCYAPAPWTPPAHASLFTGLVPSHHGLREGVGDTIRAGIEPLAETLSRAGYETVAACANPLLDACGLLDGFATRLPVNPRGLKKVAGGSVVEAVGNWLTERREAAGARKPLFLFVNLMDCHLPYRPAKRDLEAVHGAEAARRLLGGAAIADERGVLAHLLGARTIDAEGGERLSMSYDGGVRGADRATADLFALLESEGILQEAFVAVTADHGEMLGEHGLFEHRHSLHEPTLHVPLVVRWPQHLDGGRRVAEQVRLQDLYPTLLEAARAAAAPGCGADATSLLALPLRPRRALAQLEWAVAYIPMLRSNVPDAPPEAFDLFRRASTAAREASVGPTRAKLVLSRRLLAGGEVVDEGGRLYDIAADPGEEHDLLGPDAGPREREIAETLGAYAAPYGD